MNPSVTSPSAAGTGPVFTATTAPRAVAGLSLAMLLSALGTSIAYATLPTLAQAFEASFQAVQGVVLAYLVSVTSLIVSIGRLGDLFGRRRVLLAGIWCFAGASLLAGFAPTLGLLVAARAAQGAGAAAMMALTLTFVGDLVPPARTGRTMGLLGTMSALGTALGPSLGGILSVVAGWRAIFLFSVPLGLAAWFLLRHSLPADRRPAGGRPAFDGAGTALLALALGSFALAVTRRGQPLHPGLLALAGGAALLFVYVERRVAAPLVRLSLLRDRALRAGLAASGLVATVMMTTLVVGPFYLSRTLGLEAAAVGLVLSLGPLAAALAGVPAGRLVDRFGPHRLTLAGLTGIATSAVLLAVLPTSLGLAGYVAPVVTLTASYALFQTANPTAVKVARPSEQRGVVSALLSLSRNLGLISGASVMGAVFTAAAGTPDLASATPGAATAGMRVAYAVAATLIAVAFMLVIAGRNQPNGNALPAQASAR